VDDLDKRREDLIEVEEPPVAEEVDDLSPITELKGSDDLPVPFTMPDFGENLFTLPFETPGTTMETLPGLGESLLTPLGTPSTATETQLDLEESLLTPLGTPSTATETQMLPLTDQ
jgi:hypothetical protein